MVASVEAGPSLADLTVKWSSSDTTVAIVDSTGVVTGLAVGRATVIAAWHSNLAITGDAVVTVIAAAATVR